VSTKIRTPSPHSLIHLVCISFPPCYNNILLLRHSRSLDSVFFSLIRAEECSTVYPCKLYATRGSPSCWYTLSCSNTNQLLLQITPPGRYPFLKTLIGKAGLVDPTFDAFASSPTDSVCFMVALLLQITKGKIRIPLTGRSRGEEKIISAPIRRVWSKAILKFPLTVSE
jgi:hypothetical protein